jgi:hypothetical protein
MCGMRHAACGACRKMASKLPAIFAIRPQSLPAESFASLNLDFGGKFPPLTTTATTAGSSDPNNMTMMSVGVDAASPPPLSSHPVSSL